MKSEAIHFAQSRDLLFSRQPKINNRKISYQ